MTQQTAKERLALALPYIFGGFQDAKKKGIPTLVVAARDEGGGGQMILTINDPEDFLRDIAEVAGVSFELTQNQKMKCEAASFLSKFKTAEHLPGGV